MKCISGKCAWGAAALSISLLAASVIASPLFAQSGLLQQKIADLKASTAANQQRLHQYTWLETMRITLNGDAKPAKESACSYGPDGKVIKVPLGGTEEAASSSGNNRRGGALRQRIVEKKTEEIKDYMKQVQGLLALYLPPNPQKMEQAFQAKRVSISREGSTADIVFQNYELTGDKMTIGFDSAAKKIRTLNVQSYLNSPQDGVTLTVEFASLPDGTNYPLRTTLNAQAKQLTAVTTNSNYRKAGQ